MSDFLLAVPSGWPAELSGVLIVALALTAAGAVVLHRRLVRRTRELEQQIEHRGRIESEIETLRGDMERRIRERTLALEARNQELSRQHLALETANQRLRRLVAVDALTGIANRRHFDRTLERELRRARRNGEPVSLVFLDIDEFKRFNDTYGHARGDEVLQRVARTLDETFRRGGDLVARYGGEEFAVILPGLDGRRAGLYAERLRRRVWRMAISYPASPASDRVTISAGVATTLPGALVAAVDLLYAADKALYRAKCLGRNRIATTGVESSADPAVEMAS